MRYHNITKDDMLNGDGLRVVLWAMGHAGSSQASCFASAAFALLKIKREHSQVSELPGMFFFIFSMAHFSQKKHHPQGSYVLKNGTYSGPPGVRTLDTLIKSQVLYQLS